MRRLSAVFFLLAWSATTAAVSESRGPSFQTEVMPVLSRAGCNLGTCHGNKNGKGGFKLSLRGEDWRKDYDALTRQEGGRRTNRIDPEQSLALLKPLMEIPHEGGRRFREGDLEHEILFDWISAGTPVDSSPELPTALEVTPQEAWLSPAGDTVEVKAIAHFADGTRRDVTDLVVFETSNLLAEVSGDGQIRLTGPGEATVTVRYLQHQTPIRLAYIPEAPDFRWTGSESANFIDNIAFAKLQKLKINPSGICDDQTFVRRAYLDLLGLLPTASEARAFVNDASPSKRTQLIDQLLARPEFATFWALKWSDLLRAEEKSLDEKGIKVYVEWIRESIASNKPLDEFAKQLVSARGSTYEVAPANFYRSMRDPFTRSESVAQLFLGIRLQCAKCHNHPFDQWTQADYYGWANNFSKIDYEIKENKRRDKNDKHEFVGEQIVFLDEKKDAVPNPDTGEKVPARFLDFARTAPSADGDPLNQLAEWLTSRENRQFARVLVNRVWSELLGRGLVDPTDDFRATNPPSNPELLEALAQDLVEHDFDLQHLIRQVMTSNIYQLASATNITNEGDQTNFSHAEVRRLTAEQLLDTMTQVTGASVTFEGYEPGTRAAEIMGVSAIHGRRGGKEAGDRFLKLFGKPPRLTPCDCERSDETTLAQTFRLLSGDLIDELLSDENNRLAKMVSSDLTSEELIEELYWSALTRGPTEEEQTAAIAHLDSSNDRREAIQDVAWAILNSSEFLLRR